MSLFGFGFFLSSALPDCSGITPPPDRLAHPTSSAYQRLSLTPFQNLPNRNRQKPLSVVREIQHVGMIRRYVLKCWVWVVYTCIVFINPVRHFPQTQQDGHMAPYTLRWGKIGSL